MTECAALRRKAGKREAPQHLSQRIQGPRQQAPQPPRGSEPSPVATMLTAWEQALPGNWLSRIGAIALFIGLGFLAKLAYDKEWIGPIYQLLVGLLFGGGMLLAGHYWTQRYRVWAQAITGAGVAVLYLSLFASYALNDLVGFFPTFVLMFLVTAGAAVLALRQESMAIAIIGIAGAFLVPIILGAAKYSGSGAEGSDTHPGLLIGYILVLDAGIAWLATFRNWRWFTLLGFVGSLGVYGMWYASSGDEVSTLAAHGGLTAIFAFFVGATTLFHLIWRRTPETTDLVLMSLNAAAYFGITCHLLWDDYRGWLGLASFLLAALYGFLAYTALRVSRDNERLGLFAVAIGIVFLTVAIPVQLQRSWITVAWAAEGAVLLWIASREGIRPLQLWGLGVLALVLIRLFAFDTFVDQASFRPLAEDSLFLPFAISIVAFYAAAHFLRQSRDAMEPWLHQALVLIGSFLTVWLLSAEIINYAGSRIIAAQADPALIERVASLENGRALELVALWAAYGLGMVSTGLWKRLDWLRPGGYALLAIAAGTTLVMLNYGTAGIARDASTPLFNWSFVAFAACTAAFYLCARAMSKNSERLGVDETMLFPVLVIGASFLTVWALSSEIYTFVGSGETRDNARALGMVALWAAYAVGLIMYGVWSGWTWLRVAGYFLVAIAAGATLATLNYSSAMIDGETYTPIFNHSFGAFAISAVALYVSAYVVADSSRKLLESERLLLPTLLVGANVLTLWALSSEVLAFAGTDHARNLGLTVMWAAYGLVLVTVGIAGSWRWVRIGGLALVCVAIAKLFVFETFTLESGYRVAAYLSLGTLLLAGGFLYHKYSYVIRGLIDDEQPDSHGTV